MAGVASTRSVPVSSIEAAAEVPRTKPPQRAPEPVEERIDDPASSTPLMVMVDPSAIRNDTPSWMVIVAEDESVRDWSSV